MNKNRSKLNQFSFEQKEKFRDLQCGLSSFDGVISTGILTGVRILRP